MRPERGAFLAAVLLGIVLPIRADDGDALTNHPASTEPPSAWTAKPVLPPDAAATPYLKAHPEIAPPAASLSLSP